MEDHMGRRGLVHAQTVHDEMSGKPIEESYKDPKGSGLSATVHYHQNLEDAGTAPAHQVGMVHSQTVHDEMSGKPVEETYRDPNGSGTLATVHYHQSSAGSKDSEPDLVKSPESENVNGDSMEDTNELVDDVLKAKPKAPPPEDEKDQENSNPSDPDNDGDDDSPGSTNNPDAEEDAKNAQDAEDAKDGGDDEESEGESAPPPPKKASSKKSVEYVDSDSKLFPIKVPADVQKAIQGYGSATSQMPLDAFKSRLVGIAQSKGQPFVDVLPRQWLKDHGVEVQEHELPIAKLGEPNVLKVLHDLLCPAFDTVDIFRRYPELAKSGSIQDVLGPDTLSTVRELMVQCLAEEEQTLGTQGAVIKSLGDVYSSIAEFLMSSDLQKVVSTGEDTVLSVIGDTRKAFSDLFPDQKLSPTDPPLASVFRRGFLSDGRARNVAAGGDKSPSVKPSGITANQFTDNGVTAGQAAGSPASTASNAAPSGSSGKVIYDAAQRSQMSAALQSMHDSLSKLDSSCCPTGGHGGELFVHSETGALKPESPKPGSAFLSADSDLSKASLAEDSAADLVKVVMPEEVKSLVDAAKAEQQAVITDLAAQVLELSEKLDKMASEPDPRRAAYRGSVVPVEKAAVVAPPESGYHPMSEQDEDHAIRIAMMQKMAEFAPEPAVRESARARLKEYEDSNR
jgi:hypothetical protein